MRTPLAAQRKPPWRHSVLLRRACLGWPPVAGSANGGSDQLIFFHDHARLPGECRRISGLLPYITQKEGFYKEVQGQSGDRSFQTGTDATVRWRPRPDRFSHHARPRPAHGLVHRRPAGRHSGAGKSPRLARRLHHRRVNSCPQLKGGGGASVRETRSAGSATWRFHSMLGVPAA